MKGRWLGAPTLSTELLHNIGLPCATQPLLLDLSTHVAARVSKSDGEDGRTLSLVYCWGEGQIVYGVARGRFWTESLDEAERESFWLGAATTE